ncbi:hypothetical protein [Collinsella sp. UBA1693]|uniref:hypothetical protein n=1 Tax=Collinsella sp. UBA1693 TaxID=1946385 RepID=UPI00257E173C|nr:hypothetical protein [Collinsella sp. UBA1693]
MTANPTTTQQPTEAEYEAVAEQLSPRLDYTSAFVMNALYSGGMSEEARARLHRAFVDYDTAQQQLERTCIDFRDHKVILAEDCCPRETLNAFCRYYFSHIEGAIRACEVAKAALRAQLRDIVTEIGADGVVEAFSFMSKWITDDYDKARGTKPVVELIGDDTVISVMSQL